MSDLSTDTIVTVTPKKGGLNHLTSLVTPGRTACNRSAKGWVVATSKVNCKKCLGE